MDHPRWPFQNPWGWFQPTSPTESRQVSCLTGRKSNRYTCVLNMWYGCGRTNVGTSWETLDIVGLHIYIYTVLAGGLTYVFCPFWWSALTGWYFAGIETTNQRIMEISSHSTLGDFGGKQVRFFVLFSQHPGPGNIFLPLTLCWVTS